MGASAAIGSALVIGTLFLFPITSGILRMNTGIDLWAGLRSPSQIAEGSPDHRQPVSSLRAQPVSQDAWAPGVLDMLAHAHPEAGQQIASTVCAACHGEGGASPSDDIPSIGGQTAASVYKELLDFHTGARTSRRMTPVVQTLQATDLVSLAAYYGNTKPNGGLGGRRLSAGAATVRLATQGDPVRSIPACNSCHGNAAGGPIETPVLTGQHHEYLAGQLRAYREGRRANDVDERMRNVARQLTDDEIDAVARYYEGIN